MRAQRLAGDALGTRFPARQKRMKSYRQWLRFGALSVGKLYVDAGAEKALRNNKSLLPAGITHAEGNFRPGEVVEIYNAKQEKVGLGVVEMASDVLGAIVRGEQAADRSDEAVHKDRLLMV